jgi:putative transposase
VVERREAVRLLQTKGISVRRACTLVQLQPKTLAAVYPNHVWAYDFVEEHDAHGGVLRVLTVMDEFTREALAIDVDITSSAERVIGVLSQLVAARGRTARMNASMAHSATSA